MRTKKFSVQETLTLFALLSAILPAVCPAQEADPFQLPPRAMLVTRVVGIDVSEVASRLTAVAGDALPGVALLGATLQDAVLQDAPLPSSAPQEAAAKDVAVPCIEPPPLLRWEDYRGPFQKVVGAFAQKLELRAVHPPRYKPGTVLCSLTVKDKFTLFVQDTFHPISIFEAAFNASLDQASNRDPTFGQGAGGFGRRFGADFAGQTTRRLFTDFAYPTVFGEDPRYYRLIQGSGRRRFVHAVKHTFVAQRDSGKHMFNISQWAGTATGVALNDIYHPGNERGLGPGMRRAGYSLASDMGFDVLREFWPDIAHKLHMPFRDTRPPPATETSRSPQ